MNTKTEQDQKKIQGQRTRQSEGTKKRGLNGSMLHDERKHHQEHEQEHSETRLFR